MNDNERLYTKHFATVRDLLLVLPSADCIYTRRFHRSFFLAFLLQLLLLLLLLLLSSSSLSSLLYDSNIVYRTDVQLLMDSVRKDRAAYSWRTYFRDRDAPMCQIRLSCNCPLVFPRLNSPIELYNIEYTVQPWNVCCEVFITIALLTIWFCWILCFKIPL